MYKKLNIIINTSVARSIRTKPMTVNVYCDGDSSLIYESMSAHVFKLEFQSLNGNCEYKSIDLNEPVQDLFATHYGNIAFNPKKSTIAKAMVYDDKISFVNYNDEHKKTYKHKKCIVDDKGWIYYGAITSNDKYVYALFVNQSNEDSFRVKKTMEIHVFNWDGDHYKTLRTEEYIIDISIDRNNRYMYGVDSDGNIYKYNLSEI